MAGCASLMAPWIVYDKLHCSNYDGLPRLLTVNFSASVVWIWSIRAAVVAVTNKSSIVTATTMVPCVSVLNRKHLSLLT